MTCHTRALEDMANVIRLHGPGGPTQHKLLLVPQCVRVEDLVTTDPVFVPPRGSKHSIIQMGRGCLALESSEIVQILGSMRYQNDAETVKHPTCLKHVGDAQGYTPVLPNYRRYVAFVTAMSLTSSIAWAPVLISIKPELYAIIATVRVDEAVFWVATLPTHLHLLQVKSAAEMTDVLFNSAAVVKKMDQVDTLLYMALAQHHLVEGHTPLEAAVLAASAPRQVSQPGPLFDANAVGGCTVTRKVQKPPSLDLGDFEIDGACEFDDTTLFGDVAGTEPQVQIPLPQFLLEMNTGTNDLDDFDATFAAIACQ